MYSSQVILCQSNSPFPSCFGPHCESEASCIVFIVKISFHSYVAGSEINFFLAGANWRLNIFLKSPYGKMWSPKSVNKKRTWPLAPAIRMLWETAEETWRRTFALIVAVKRCGRFMITGKSVLYFKSSGKVKSK